MMLMSQRQEPGWTGGGPPSQVAPFWVSATTFARSVASNCSAVVGPSTITSPTATLPDRRADSDAVTCERASPDGAGAGAVASSAHPGGDASAAPCTSTAAAG